MGRCRRLRPSLDLSSKLYQTRQGAQDKAKTKTKIKMIRTCIYPIGAGHLWVWGTKIWKRIRRVSVIKCFRKILIIPLMDCWPKKLLNTIKIDQEGKDKLFWTFKKTYISWKHAHLLEAKPERKRTSGRPTRRWTYTSVIGCEEEPQKQEKLHKIQLTPGTWWELQV